MFEGGEGAVLTYFADVDEATHEVPVAHGVDGVLGLVLGGVLNNTTSLHPSKSCVNQNPRAKRVVKWS
jgi:hypothetical protein